MKAFALTTVVLSTLLIAACDTTPQTNWVAACEAYASTLNTLSTARDAGKLTAAQISRVSAVEAELTPICDRPDPPTDADLLAALDRGVTALTDIAQNYE